MICFASRAWWIHTEQTRSIHMLNWKGICLSRDEDSEISSANLRKETCPTPSVQLPHASSPRVGIRRESGVSPSPRSRGESAPCSPRRPPEARRGRRSRGSGASVQTESGLLLSRATSGGSRLQRRPASPWILAFCSVVVFRGVVATAVMVIVIDWPRAASRASD